MIVLDTHVLVWWTADPAQLSGPADRALSTADRIGVPAIVFWEVAILARRKRIDLGARIDEWVRDVLSIRRIEPLHLTPVIAIEAESLAMHADPADRFIVATARHYGADLVTKDRSLRALDLVPTLW